MEWQWVRALVRPARHWLNRVTTLPVRQFEVERLADVLLDATVRGQAQRADERPVLPNREAQPVDNRVHPVQDNPPARALLAEMVEKIGWPGGHGGGVRQQARP